MKTQNQFTPGPWQIGEDGDIFAHDKTLCIANVIGAPEGLPESKANARLIAAAPDGVALAEHIQAMATDVYLTGHPEWCEITHEAAAFLAKARGD